MGQRGSRPLLLALGGAAVLGGGLLVGVLVGKDQPQPTFGSVPSSISVVPDGERVPGFGGGGPLPRLKVTTEAPVVEEAPPEESYSETGSTYEPEGGTYEGSSDFTGESKGSYSPPQEPSPPPPPPTIPPEVGGG